MSDDAGDDYALRKAQRQLGHTPYFFMAMILLAMLGIRVMAWLFEEWWQ